MDIINDWKVCLLDDVIDRMTNGSSAKQYNDKVGFPISRIETIWNESIDLGRVKYIAENSADIVEKYGLVKNDILFSHINSDNHLGKTAIYKNQTKVLIHGINLLLLRPSKELNADFLLFQLRYLKYRGRFMEIAQRAVNQSSINQKKLKQFEIILAPLPEQRAIVAKIEQLFSELDNGIRNFKTAQEQLKIYRQAVLKKAFEGELSKEWRAKQSNLPTAEELLQQIKEEREKHYQEQVLDWKQGVKYWEANGKVGRKPGKVSRLKEYPILNEMELTDFSKIADSFSWIYFGNLFCETPQNGLYKPSTLYGSGTDIIRIDNFYSGKLLSSQGYKKVKLSQDEIEKYKIENGQILINRVNSIEYLGKSGLVKNLIAPTVFESNIMKITLMNSHCSSRYIVHYLTSVLGIREIRKNAKHAVNQASINQTDVSLTAVPICSLQEQHQIVQEIESRLSVCDKLEESIQESLLKAEALRQSILKQAFDGKLLSDAELAACKKEKDWEPAELLLARIKKEKSLVSKK